MHWLTFQCCMELLLSKNIWIKGISQLECDFMHSCMERTLQNMRINVPADYISIYELARQNPRPYKVEYLDHNFFKSFASVMKYHSIRPSTILGDQVVTDTRALKYSNGKIQYKLNFSDDWKEYPEKKTIKRNEETSRRTESNKIPRFIFVIH